MSKNLTSGKKRQSYIEKKLEFLINVGNFESIRVGTVFGETIEWASVEERQKKLNSLTKSIAKEVANDAKEVLLAYGLQRNATSSIERKNRTDIEDLGMVEVDEEDNKEEENDDEEFTL